MVLPPDADGRQRHLRTLDEQLVPRSQLVAGPAVGKRMRVAEGRHAGLVCEVLEMLPVQEGRSGGCCLWLWVCLELFVRTVGAAASRLMCVVARHGSSCGIFWASHHVVQRSAGVAMPTVCA